MIATEYEISTGRMRGVHRSSLEEVINLQVQEGFSYIEGEYDHNTHYILNGEVVERPTPPVTRTDLTLHDVPNGATLFINGESYAAEGTVELEFPMPGTYSLRVECFPFLDWTDEVTV